MEKPKNREIVKSDGQRIVDSKHRQILIDKSRSLNIENVKHRKIMKLQIKLRNR